MRKIFGRHVKYIFEENVFSDRVLSVHNFCFFSKIELYFVNKEKILLCLFQ